MDADEQFENRIFYAKMIFAIIFMVLEFIGHGSFRSFVAIYALLTATEFRKDFNSIIHELRIMNIMNRFKDD